MRSRWLLVAILAGGVAAQAQTDVAASVYGAFSGTTSGNGTTQSPSNGAGVLLELRHISNPLVGYEATYSFNQADQTYTGGGVTCGIPCGNVVTPVTEHVPANAHEITGDWIVSFKLLMVRPFLLAGGGLLVNVPSGGTTAATMTQTKGVFVYGGGVDLSVLPHLGLRFQYRGNLYSAPQLATAFSSTGAFMHTAEPMGGAYFRF